MSYYGRLIAPWTDDQVTTLNRFQTESGLHPFTCMSRVSDRGDTAHGDSRGILIATRHGWVCKGCTYTQNWAYEHMANPNEVAGYIRNRAALMDETAPPR